MEEDKNSSTLRKAAADLSGARMPVRKTSMEQLVMEEDTSPEVARENIVKDMMRIFDGLLGCTSKRTGVSLTFTNTGKGKTGVITPVKPESGAQRKLEQQIYQRIKALVEAESPNTGFALNVLFNNGMYYYDKANVPLSFGIFLTSLNTFLEGHDCLSICPDEMVKLKMLLSRG